MTVTASQIREIVENSLEKTEPQRTILIWLEERNGKRITENHIKKLREYCFDESISLSRSYGMTSIVWGGYHQTGGKQGGRLFLKNETTNVVIDAQSIKERNIAYFDALLERNSERKTLLKNTDSFEILANTINTYMEAKEKLDKMVSELTDRYKIEELYSK